MVVDILCVIIFVLVITTILFTPYDEAAFRRKYIGYIIRDYDGDDNPYTSQSRYLGVERSSYSVYVAGYRRTLTFDERRLSDDALIQLMQETFP